MIGGMINLSWALTVLSSGPVLCRPNFFLVELEHAAANNMRENANSFLFIVL